MKFTFAKPFTPEKGTLVITATEGPELTASGKALDKKSGYALTKAMKAGKFKGKGGQMVSLFAPHNLGVDRLIIAGLGKADDLKERNFETLGGKLYATVANGVEPTVAVLLDPLQGCKVPVAERSARIALGAKLRSFRFDKYRTKEKKEAKPTLKSLRLLADEGTKARALFNEMDKVADGVFFTRNLVSEPANVIYPASLAKEAKGLKDLGVKVKVLGEKDMEKLGMGALLGVGQGSVRESKLVALEWNGLPKGTKQDDGPVAFVGKGVTFDSGGISIKPSAGMEDMKWDMGGSGVVIGLMKALAGRKAKAHVVGIVGLVENMPSGEAQRPGDIVTSMSGQTIEVLNTDAEGRLVLADALWYCQETYKPKIVIDLATLTGAIMVSLGTTIAGLFSNDDELADDLFASGEAVDEKVWRMPLGSDYDKMIKSDVADMKNIGGRWAGSITAAQFLKRFIQDDVKWAHLDIAGVTWSTADKPTVPKGGTGFGVRLLDRYIADHHEA